MPPAPSWLESSTRTRTLRMSSDDQLVEMLVNVNVKSVDADPRIYAEHEHANAQNRSGVEMVGKHAHLHDTNKFQPGTRARTVRLA